MVETGKYGNRPARVLYRLGIAAVAAWCWTGSASAAPIKIAVFTFELEDFSPAGKQGGTAQPVASTDEALVQATEEAKKQLLESGRYSLVDTAGADLGAAAPQGLRNCKGCEAAIAEELGADQALFGVVTKISMMEYVVKFQVTDAREGELVASFTTGLRMGADYSWSRGVRSLMKNQMLKPAPPAP